MPARTTIDMGALFEAAPTAQLVCTPDLVIVAANRRYRTMVGRGPDALVGRRIFDVFPVNPDDPDADVEPEFRASVARVVATGEADALPPLHHDVAAPDGTFEVRHWSATNHPVFADPDAPERVTHVLNVVDDITRNVLGEHVGEAKRRAAMRGADVTFFEYDPISGTLLRAPQLDALFGFGPDAPQPDAAALFARVHPEDIAGVRAEQERAVRTVGSDLHQDYRVVWPDGTVRWLLERGESLRDPETQGVRIVGVVLDVTAIKENEARLAEALAARDMLIAEVNHRVKNSLNVVTSILALEARRTSDPDAISALGAATARIRAIAAIHALLYEDDDVRSVRFDRYLARLGDHLRASLASPGRTVRIAIEAEPLHLPTDKAITASLVINELVTNSFKHGFRDGDEGTVTVRLRRDGDATVLMEVADDGTSDPARALSPEAPSTGLGQRLIAGMAAQLNGTVDEERRNGWRTRILFPI